MAVKTQPDAESDAALIASFARLRDERAFAELVQRHGPMVFGVCSRMLGHRQDAEDALQAVFLTLSAKARSLRRVRCIAGWLHNVAVRISLNLLKMNRRREHGLQSFRNECAYAQRDESHDLKELLDEELAQLPARLKETVILRDLEGYSRSETARRLGVSLSTVDNRLSRGHKLLRDRLVRRGVPVGSAGLAAALAQCADASPALGIELAHQTVRNAQLFLAGKSAEGLSAATKITSLAQGVLNTMFLTKLSTTVCVAALAAALVLGASPISTMLGLTSNVRAGEFFLDDFEDGSAADGLPVRWIPLRKTPFNEGSRDVVDGSYIITPGTTPSPDTPGYYEADSVVEGQEFREVTIRTRVRALRTGQVFAGLAARNPLSADSALWAAVTNEGRLVVGAWDIPSNSAQEWNYLNSGLNLFQRDINLKFHVGADEAWLSAWAEGDAEPIEPQIVVDDLPDYLRTSGEIGIWTGGFANGPERVPVAFRYVEAVPEPSSVALGSLGFIALAAFGIRTRLLHVRSSR